MPEQPTKERNPRRDSGPRLIERDLDALKWIAQQYAIRLDHLCVLLARLIEPGAYAQAPKTTGQLTEKRATAIVKRWETLGLVERAWILYNEPPWIALTPEGLRLVSEELGELRPYTPTPAKLNHLYHINLTRLLIEARRPGIHWVSEREIRASQGKTQQGVKRPHTPDAIVQTNSKQIAVEVELSTKIHARLDKILHELALSADYHTVWYFCKGRANTVIHTAINAMQEMYRGKFVIYKLDDMHL